MPKKSKNAVFKCLRHKSNSIYAYTNGPKPKPNESNAPKVMALINKIKELDSKDENESGTKFKHFIYSELKRSAGITVLADALEMNGFECVLQKQGESMIFKERPPRKQTGYGILFSQTFKGVPKISEKVKTDLLNKFNHDVNSHGDHIRIILIDSQFKEGIDLKDVKYAHILEETMTNSDLTQIIGRGTRQCGQKNLKFVANVGWTLDVFRYILQIPDTLKQKYMSSIVKRNELKSTYLFDEPTLKEFYSNFADLDSSEINTINQLTQLGPYLGIDHYLTKDLHNKFDFTKDPFNMLDDVNVPQSEIEDITDKTYSHYKSEQEKREEERFIAEQKKIEEERKRAEERRIAEEQRREEERIRAEEQRLRAEERRLAEEQRLEQERIERELKRIDDELRRDLDILMQREKRLEEQTRKAEEQERLKREALEKEEQRLAQLAEQQKISELEEERRKMILIEKERRIEEERELAQKRQEEAEARIERERQDAEDREREKRERVEQLQLQAEENRIEQERIVEENRRREEQRQEEERQRIEDERELEEERRRIEQQKIIDTAEEMKQKRLKRLEKSGISQSNIIESRSRRRADGGGSFSTQQDLHKFVYKTFGKWKWTKKFEDSCNNRGPPELNPSQKFIKHYFTPQLREKGLLLWHSVGSGKTCTAIACASAEFEEQGYNIIWVTRPKLKTDVDKNIFGDVVCHQRVRKGSKSYKEKKLDSKIWNAPISHRTFSNLCKSEANQTNVLSRKLLNNGKKHGGDFLYKTLVIIDEAHFLYGKTGGDPNELPQTKYIERAFDNSYKTSGENSVKVLLMTATPITEKPDELIKLINLCKPPGEKSEISNLPRTIQSMGWRKFIDTHLLGYISYVNRMYDPSQFAQVRITDIKVDMSLYTDKNDKNNQEYVMMEKCFDVPKSKIVVEAENPFAKIAKLAQSTSGKLSPKLKSSVDVITHSNHADKIRFFNKIKDESPKLYNELLKVIKAATTKQDVMDADDIKKLQKLFTGKGHLFREFNSYLPRHKQIPTPQEL
jgi:hypothetical protein